MMQRRYDRRHFRLQLVRHAQEHGIKPAARVFGTTPATVRKWLRRWDGQSLGTLADRSRAPKQPARKLDLRECARALELKRQLITFGAKRLKRLFALALSEKAIRTLWHEQALLKKVRKKHQTKQDLRAQKALWELFEQSCVDTKDLIDIPEYYFPMNTLRLPKVQYTFREVVSGLHFFALASERSLPLATLFIRLVLEHLQTCGVRFSNSRIQTDNGSEFIGSWNSRHDSAFTHAIHQVPGLTHTTIPPKAHTWQADVETVHRLIEDEFYRIESFHSRSQLLDKATAYVRFFNIARPNSYKHHKTPWQIIHERDPTITPKIATLPVFYLDDLWKTTLDTKPKRVYDVIQYPYSVCNHLT
jgi:transposase